MHTDSVDFLRLLKRAKGQNMNKMGERYWQYSSLAERLITCEFSKLKTSERTLVTVLYSRCYVWRTVFPCVLSCLDSVLY
jgi:hypothetical protein